MYQRRSVNYGDDLYGSRPAVRRVHSAPQAISRLKPVEVVHRYHISADPDISDDIIDHAAQQLISENDSGQPIKLVIEKLDGAAEVDEVAAMTEELYVDEQPQLEKPKKSVQFGVEQIKYFRKPPPENRTGPLTVTVKVPAQKSSPAVVQHQHTLQQQQYEQQQQQQQYEQQQQQQQLPYEQQLQQQQQQQQQLPYEQQLQQQQQQLPYEQQLQQQQLQYKQQQQLHYKQQQLQYEQQQGVFQSYPSAEQLLEYLPQQASSGESVQVYQSQVVQPPPLTTDPYLASMFSQIAQITDNLYLSSCHALQHAKLRNLGITHVVNATKEVADVSMPEIHSIRVLVNDVPSAQLTGYFDKVADKVDKVRKSGGRVLIHCVAGVSRSASLVIAYLMKYHRMSLLEAYTHVKSRRPVIRPNVGFFKQLIAYEKKLLGKNSVKMINSPMGTIPDVYEEEARNMVRFNPKR